MPVPSPIVKRGSYDPRQNRIERCGGSFFQAYQFGRVTAESYRNAVDQIGFGLASGPLGGFRFGDVSQPHALGLSDNRPLGFAELVGDFLSLLKGQGRSGSDNLGFLVSVVRHNVSLLVLVRGPSPNR